MTLNPADYTAHPSAWYVTRTVMEPAGRPGFPAESWRMTSRSGSLPIRLLTDARWDVSAEAGRAQQGEGYRFADYGPKQHGVKTVVLQKTEVGSGFPRTHRIEIALVSGRERQEEIDDDLADRLRELNRSGTDHWGQTWAIVLARVTETAQAMGVSDTPLARVQAAHLAWEWCNDVAAAREAGAPTEGATR